MAASSVAKQATIFETTDGAQFLHAEEAQQHQLRVNVRAFHDSLLDGLDITGADADRLVGLLVEHAGAMLTAIKDAAAIVPPTAPAIPE